MGASGWDYVVPYQDDIASALRELQQQVFQRREYVDPYGKWQPAKNEFDSIMELRIACAENGTHSILDVELADPLETDYLISFFGTTQPTKAQIEGREEEFDMFLSETAGRYRWDCTYVILFENSAPSEIYFAGYSGD